MREILFRGKRVDNGEWVKGAYGKHTSFDAMIMDRPYPTINGDLSALNFGSTPKVVEKVRKDKKRRGSACQRQGKFLKQNL